MLSPELITAGKLMRFWVSALVICLALAGSANSAPLVYTGQTVAFSKTSFADPSDPANQDRIVGDVAITRGSSTGIYNAAVEQSFTSNSSPQGTRWAFGSNNSGVTPAATDWASLTFEDWQTSLNGMGSLATNILAGPAVVHLVNQDVYLDIHFTAWGQGSGAGGSFTYERAEVTPSADFDRDGHVDGRDFLTWQRKFGIPSPRQTDGDANFDGAVDAADLAAWQENYGAPLLPPAASTAVPEPPVIGLIFAVGALTTYLFRR
jgi:hypothetical protein